MSLENKKTIINIIEFNTPLGEMYACATTQGICLLEFIDKKSESNELSNRINSVILVEENQHLNQLKIELQEYFATTRKFFDVKLDMIGTNFQKLVWKGLVDIPYGETWSYKKQANYLNIPKSVRAVANGNGQNKIAIIVPCHRVIGADGSLRGYSSGLYRKKWLLDFEKLHFS